MGLVSVPNQSHKKPQAISGQIEPRLGQQGVYQVYWDYTSFYSEKLRVFLNYKEIPYRLVQISLEDYFEKMPELVGMSLIPVVLTPDERIMQDSTPMMEWFEGEYPERATVPGDSRLAWLMWLIEEFSDEYVVRLANRTRWGSDASGRTLGARIARRFSRGQSTEQIAGLAQHIRERQTGNNLLLGLETPENCRNVDQQILDLLSILDEHLSEHDYLLGDRPSMADFALFGAFWAHGYNDPWSAEIMEVNAPQVCNWVQEMASIGDSRGALGRTEFGQWLDLDQDVPDTLNKLLAFIASTYLPQARGYVGAMLDQQPTFTASIYGLETELPRFDYRAGTFADLQQRFVKLPEVAKDWLTQIFADSGLFPELMMDGIHPNPHFAELSAPFVSNPEHNRLAYEGEQPLREAHR